MVKYEATFILGGNDYVQNPIRRNPRPYGIRLEYRQRLYPPQNHVRDHEGREKRLRDR